MRQSLITGAKAAGILTLLIVGATFALQVYSSAQNDEGPQLRRFVLDAQKFHRKIEGGALLDGFALLLEAVATTVPDGSPELRARITNGSLAARGYTEQFDWLTPPTEALDLMNSLRREGQLLQRTYSRLGLAWSARESGDESACEQYREEARDLFEQALSLRALNTTLLDEAGR